MQSLAELIPGVVQEAERKAAEKVSNVAKMEPIVRDDAWVYEQKQNIRTGVSKNSNALLQIPQRFIGKNLADYEGSEDLKRSAYADFLHKNLFLWGPCGTGKTHLSCGLLLNFYSDMTEFDPETKTWKRSRARFISVLEFLSKMKSAIGSNESDLITSKAF